MFYLAIKSGLKSKPGFILRQINNTTVLYIRLKSKPGFILRQIYNTSVLYIRLKLFLLPKNNYYWILVNMFQEMEDKQNEKSFLNRLSIK
jgi:hypothetical protein